MKAIDYAATPDKTCYELWGNDYCFGEPSDLPDPHFQTEQVYRSCFDTIERGCKEIVTKLKQS